jgi:class 3 adenylate cyclase
VAVCASCGTENPEGFRFCGGCGAALAAAAEPRREERKVVTVLFADLVGFASRAEQLDPEDVRALLAPYWQRLRAELERFGGTVEKFIGDAVMALFGAPAAHEDDPERAVRAALAIRDWARDEGLQVRIAVTTGEALVMLGAQPAAGEGMATGDVVTTAARLQEAAPVNGVIVGEQTYRATRHVIDYRPAEAVQAKGKAAPVPVWEAAEARSRLGVDVAAEPAARLVGRARELGLVVDAFERARGGPATQLVTLVGVPGIGKSRLVAELASYARASPELVSWRQGRSLPYGEGASFWAVAELVKAQAGILESDTAAQAEERLAGAVLDLLGDDPDLPWITGRLRALVGAGGETDAFGEGSSESFAAWRRFFEAMAERRPLVLVYEDLQWADDGLLDFVDHLVGWAGDVPLLVVCTARPELLDRRPGWGGGKPNALTLSLAPLDDEETALLVHELLEQALLPAETQAALVARAGGNPLYAEQFARLLVERGSLEEVPETVQGIIAARLDLLSSDEKALLQDAAVLGKVFWAGAAAAVGGQSAAAVRELLHRLERKEFLSRARHSSVAGETEYAFRHSLVRDVAYGQLPRAARAERHRAAAEWILALGRPDDHAELVAHHRLAALELADAAGLPREELAAAAARALRDAGDRAARLQSRPAALGLYRRALELTPADDPARGLLLLRAGEAAVEAEAPDAGTLLDDAARVLEERGDVASAAEAEAAHAMLDWLGGVDVLARFEHAASLVADEPDSPSKAYVYAQLGRTLTVAGRAAQATESLRTALAIADRLDLVDIRLYALHYVGLARAQSGDPGGRAEMEASIELARTHDPTFVPRALNNVATVAYDEGNPQETLTLSLEALRTAERLGISPMIRWQHMIQVGVLTELGEWDEGLALLAAHPSLFEPGYYHAPAARSIETFIRFARGSSDEAELRRALEEAAQLDDPQATMPVYAPAVFVLAEAGRLDDANAALDAYIRTARAMPRPHYGYCAVVALTARRLGRATELSAAFERYPSSRWPEVVLAVLDGRLADAADMLASMGAREPEAFVRLAAAEELIAAGLDPGDHLERATAFFRRVRATRYLLRADALLAATA